MAKKVFNSLLWYFVQLEKCPTEKTWRDYSDQHKTLSDLVYEMWRNDLISDNVKNECFEVLQKSFARAIPLHGKIER